MDVPTRLHHCPISSFMGLMAEGTLHHCVLFIWEMVDFLTKSHEMGSRVLTRPCHHLSVVVVLRATRVTPSSLSVGFAPLWYPSCLGFFYLFTNNLWFPLCMHCWYRVFPPLKEVGYSSLVLVTVRTFNSTSPRVDMEN
jgi:hypothetical protein